MSYDQVVGLLEEGGHQVVGVETAADALIQLDHFKPDMVIMNPRITVAEPGEEITDPELEAFVDQSSCGLRMLQLAKQRDLRVPPTAIVSFFPPSGFFGQALIEDVAKLMPDGVRYEIAWLPCELRHLVDGVIPKLLAAA